METSIALQVDQQRAEGFLGASDASCALGLSPYKAPITLWRQLRGEEVNDNRPSYVNEAAEWGQILEPVVRGRYALQQNRAILVPRASRTLDGWLRCTPDGLVMPADSFEPGTYDEGDFDEDDFLAAPDGLLQCKTASAYLRDAWAEGVPPAYEVQVRVEMAVTKLPWCDVVCLIGGQRFVGPFRVMRDAGLEDRILTDLAKFWESVKRGIQPAVDNSEAWMAIANERFTSHKNKIAMAADDETRAEVDAWRGARAAEKQAKALKDELRNKLLMRMSAVGATELMYDADTKISAYRTGAKPSWQRYAISLGGSAKPPAQFMGENNSWALRAPKDEED